MPGWPRRSSQNGRRDNAADSPRLATSLGGLIDWLRGEQ
jgi:hypothetical protein